MEAVDIQLASEKTSYPDPHAQCPMCGGRLIERGRESSCCQCFFRIREGCEGDQEPDG